MNKLPKAIQNEINEFARGDRKHWKSTFVNVMDELDAQIYCVQWNRYYNQSNTRTQDLIHTVKRRSRADWTLESIRRDQYVVYSFKDLACLLHGSYGNQYWDNHAEREHALST